MKNQRHHKLLAVVFVAIASGFATAPSADAQTNKHRSTSTAIVHPNGKIATDSEAVYILTCSAVAGWPESQTALAKSFAEGKFGLHKDNIEAYKWASLAADQGFGPAKELVEQLESLLTREQIADAKEAAKAYTGLKTRKRSQ